MTRPAAALLLVTTACLAGCACPVLTWPDTDVVATAAPDALRVGAAAEKITPPSPEFLAGGIPFRISGPVHDDLWARAVVFEADGRRIAMVTLDLIGIFYDQVVLVREAVADEVDCDYVLLAATHTHSAPDVLEFWSPMVGCYESSYLRYVGAQTARAVREAVEAARPARLRVASADAGEPRLSRDTRPPDFIDDTLTVWQAADAETDAVICTAVHYASHPILVPSLNFAVSSDFPHYLRLAVEEGMTSSEGDVPAQGGVCLFFNAALGGRIVPDHTDELADLPADVPAFDAALAYGFRLAQRAVTLLDEQGEAVTGETPVLAASRQIRVPVANALFMLQQMLGLTQRATVDGELNSEVAIVQVGPLRFFGAPGMIFPESLSGGVQSIPGSDFPDATSEPALYGDAEPGVIPVAVGFANDMLGYIIPKPLWDSRSPYTDEGPPYGEIVSPGPETAGIVYEAFAALRETVSAEAP